MQRHLLNANATEVENWDDDPDIKLEDARLEELQRSNRSSTSYTENIRAVREVNDLLEFSDDECDQRSPSDVKIRKSSNLANARRKNLKEEMQRLKGSINLDSWIENSSFASEQIEEDEELLTLRPIRRAPKGRVSSLFKLSPGGEKLDNDNGLNDTIKARKLHRLTGTGEIESPDRKSQIDDFQLDFDLPPDLTTFNLNVRKTPQAPLHLSESSDADNGWDDDSSNSNRYTVHSRSSIMSTFSPSSSITYESEDDGLIGLEIPEGPFNFRKLLDHRLKAVVEANMNIGIATPKEDILEGLEIGDNEIFEIGKQTINRNVKQKTWDGSSLNSPKKSNITQIFAPKPTRIPRPIQSTPAASSKHLENLNKFSQMVGETPKGERRLSHKSSMVSVKSTGISQGNRLLSNKKSMPSLRSAVNDNLSDPAPPLPSLPSIPNLSHLQQQNTGTPVSLPKQPNLRRIVSRGTLLPEPKRLSSRTSITKISPPLPNQQFETPKSLLKPVKRQLFGDGTELDDLDDLPISSAREQKPLERKNIAPNPIESQRSRKKKVQQRPHLIKPMGDVGSLPRTEKGMHYNPATFKWEGNEQIEKEFDNAMLTPPRPALISNITSNKGVQVVGGMVFDPNRMCWFKTNENGQIDEEDEDDPFADFDDVDDGFGNLSLNSGKSRSNEFSSPLGVSSSSSASTGVMFGEFVVGEEFDVGPAFTRRQIDEEERWRRKVQGWYLPQTTHYNHLRHSHSNSLSGYVSGGGNLGLNRDYLFEIRNLVMNRE
ncbi:hypothetical protein V1511DRAFT_492343 [Dipodascopsis uninucleata]